MSLSIEVTKGSVTTTQNKLYSITLHVVLTDTVGVGFTKDYTCEYRTGESVSTKEAKFIGDIQQDVDRYKAAQTLAGTTAFATSITNIKNGISL